MERPFLRWSNSLTKAEAKAEIDHFRKFPGKFRGIRPSGNIAAANLRITPKHLAMQNLPKITAKDGCQGRKEVGFPQPLALVFQVIALKRLIPPFGFLPPAPPPEVTP